MSPARAFRKQKEIPGDSEAKDPENNPFAGIAEFSSNLFDKKIRGGQLPAIALGSAKPAQGTSNCRSGVSVLLASRGPSLP